MKHFLFPNLRTITALSGITSFAKCDQLGWCQVRNMGVFNQRFNVIINDDPCLSVNTNLPGGMNELVFGFHFHIYEWLDLQ